jgi:hypothetical protein
MGVASAGWEPAPTAKVDGYDTLDIFRVAEQADIPLQGCGPFGRTAVRIWDDFSWVRSVPERYDRVQLLLWT